MKRLTTAATLIALALFAVVLSGCPGKNMTSSVNLPSAASAVQTLR